MKYILDLKWTKTENDEIVYEKKDHGYSLFYDIYDCVPYYPYGLWAIFEKYPTLKKRVEFTLDIGGSDWNKLELENKTEEGKILKHYVHHRLTQED